MMIPGSGIAKSRLNSQVPASISPSISSVVTSSMWSAIALIRRGRKALATSRRYAVWTGGSVRCSVSTWPQPRSRRICSYRRALSTCRPFFVPPPRAGAREELRIGQDEAHVLVSGHHHGTDLGHRKDGTPIVQVLVEVPWVVLDRGIQHRVVHRTRHGPDPIFERDVGHPDILPGHEPSFVRRRARALPRPIVTIVTNTDRLLSLAAGVCPETAPADFVTACATAGWKACGIWFDPDTWNCRRGRRRAASARRHRTDRAGHGTRLRHAGRRPRRSDDRGGRDDRRAQPARGVARRRRRTVSPTASANCATSRRRTTSDAVSSSCASCRFATCRRRCAVLDRVDRANAAVLIDLLHLVSHRRHRRRCGVDRRLHRLPYVQLCDAPRAAPEDLYTEAIDGRLLPGDGELPIVELVDVLPAHTALSMEIRSAALRSAWPDPVDRARHVLDSTMRALA